MSRILNLALACCSIVLLGTSCSVFDLFSHDGGEYGRDRYIIVMITPSDNVRVNSGGTRQFTATAFDTVSAVLVDPQPTFTWSINPGNLSGGSIDQNGLFTAGAIGSHPRLVIATATVDGVVVTESVDVTVFNGDTF